MSCSDQTVHASWAVPFISVYSRLASDRPTQTFAFSKKKKKADGEGNNPVNHFFTFNLTYRHCLAHTVSHSFSVLALTTEGTCLPLSHRRNFSFEDVA